ncbi:MAG: peptidoglycan editing factor PgeF [Bacillota bacterium]
MNIPWLEHAFTTRSGGVSEGAFASLNLSFLVGDLPERVLENRRRLADALRYDPERVVCGRQVHGDNVAVVTPQVAGSGAFDPETALAATDGLITSSSGIPLMAFFADCVPVMLLDTENRTVGIVHAGWRGTAQEISVKALSRMSDVFGTRSSRCLAVIGPAIGSCCYTVNEPVAVEFNRWGREIVYKDEGGWRVNLWEANRKTLIEAGVPPENVSVIDVCTACRRELMFSHRRDAGRTGRMSAVVMIRPEGC